MKKKCRNIRRIPAERWADRPDLIEHSMFLASKASDYINGHILVVDGGCIG